MAGENDVPIEDIDDPLPKTLIVRVETTGEFLERGADAIETLSEGGRPKSGASLSLESYDDLQRVLSPRNIELLETIREREPRSIRELARLVERDVSRVYDNVTELARLNIIELREEGQARRPVMHYDRIEVDIPITTGSKRQDSVPM